ncbi:hypothetical protein FO519_005324 [Halicephalobus sp. NKZ332]|nr:hypothetical protein FO519_005324 [Halicephalobus sp. NKZ332]
MNGLKRIVSNMNMEPAIFFYMCSSFMKYPIFMNLIYEKSCYQRYNDVGVDCQNISAVYDDKKLQTDANHLYLFSSIVLLIPSIVVSLVLGSLSDSWSVKIPMMIPFVGHILGDLSYIIQATKIEWDPYWLLISDLITGVSGGFTAIIGTILSYNVKMTSTEFRSTRVASFEAAIGFGSTVGLIISGILHQSIGYANCFLIMMIMKTVGYFYIVFFAKELDIETSERERRPFFYKLYEVFEFLLSYRTRDVFVPLIQVLIALSVEMFVYAGISDILYSYLRYTLGWNDKPYGWFNGIASGISSVLVLVLYPLLHNKLNFHDLHLAILGICSKVLFLFMFAFLFSVWWAYLSQIPLVFNRFVSTGLRAGCSEFVDDGDQGKLFSMISMIEGITTILASILFNGLYPMTLDFFPGTCFVVVALSMLLPIGLTSRVIYSNQSSSASEDSQ